MCVAAERSGDGCRVVGVLRPDARDPVAQVGRLSRRRRRGQEEAQENQVRHTVDTLPHLFIVGICAVRV